MEYNHLSIIYPTTFFLRFFLGRYIKGFRGLYEAAGIDRWRLNNVLLLLFYMYYPRIGLIP